MLVYYNLVEKENKRKIVCLFELLSAYLRML